MKLSFKILSIAMLALFTACHDVVEYADNPRGNFESLWSTLDQRYCFFQEKGIDWDSIHAVYSPRISDKMTSQELFDVCADMLGELRDGHVNLIAPFNTSYYRQWWSAYPENFNKRLIEESYFNYNYRQTSGMMYGYLSENIGYIYYGSFSSAVGEGNLDYVLHFLRTANGLIIDVRNNGGGSISEVETFVSRFIRDVRTVGYISHKTGPGHGDFSEPRAIVYRPAAEGRIRWGKPIVVICNRSTFSAANNFVSVMKSLPYVTVVGTRTGGGAGMPFNSELPNGWGVRFSSAPMLDCHRQSTESGVDPSEGCALDMDPATVLSGHDTILDFAVALLNR